jgi:hypothetical protein
MGLALFVSLDSIGARSARILPQAVETSAQRTYPVPMSLVREHAAILSDIDEFLRAHSTRISSHMRFSRFGSVSTTR